MSKLEITIPAGTQQINYRYAVDAPRDLVHRCYVEPELLVQWLGPSYLTMTVDLYEPRHGGRYVMTHRDPHGGTYVFRGVFHGDPTPERIVRTFEFDGAPGHLSLEMADFVEENGGTTILVTSVFSSVAARDGMAQSGMEAGMLDSMQRLDALLARLQA